MVCPVCNAPVEGSPKFCAKCGSKLEVMSSMATAMAPATEAEPRFDPFIGQTLGGRYKITRLLGEGGMGAVYVGEQNIGGTVRKVAVKTLHAHLSKDPKILQRFERECGTVAELQHPNTIQLYDFGKTDDGILYMVMEFVQGESLAAILEKAHALDPARALHILQQICDALGEAHTMGIVHRDLKPENVVLTERAKDWVKVLDFGIAKRTEAPEKAEPQLTQQGTVLGTPPYMSPEQFTGKPIDGRSDIYSIAVMAYEMLAGRLPFDATTPWEWATQHMTVAPKPLATPPGGRPIPESMIRAVMRGLAKDPADRFATTKDFYEALSAEAPEALAASGGAAGAVYTPAPVGTPVGAVFTPAPGASPAGAVFTPAPVAAGQIPPQPRRGATELGTPAQGFAGGAPVGYMQPAGTPPYGSGPGAPQGPYGTPGAMNLAVPPTSPRRGRGGGGALIGLIVVCLLLAGGGVVFAFLHAAKPAQSGDLASATASAPSVAAPADASDADAGSGAVANNNTAPVIDTSLPALPTSPSAATSGHAAAHLKGDAGPSSVPSTTPPSPSHSAAPAPAPTPSSPAADPPECKQARNLKTRIEKASNPSQKLFASFNTARQKCISAGGKL